MIARLIKEKFFDQNVLYIDDPKVLYTETWDWNVSLISELKSYDLVIVNYGLDDFQDSVHFAEKFFRENSINFLLISHSPVEHLITPKIVYHPYHYFQTRDTSLGYIPLWNVENRYKINVESNTKKYKLSCLNGNPRPHKILNYLLLRDKTYFKDTYFTIYNIDPFRSDDLVLDEQTTQAWLNIKLSLPTVEDLNKNFLPFPAACITSPAHIDSYVNLVVETTVNLKCFISEKTWKAVASGQLFLLLAGPGTVAHLRESGLDTFDDIIDHNYYDCEIDTKLRISKLHEVLDDLMSKDLEKINIQTKERRILNAEKFWSNKLYLNNYTIDQLETTINQCLKKS